MSPAIAPEPVDSIPTPVPASPTATMTAVDAACYLISSSWDRWQFAFSGASWADYQRLLDVRVAAGRKAVRITYSDGEVEIVSVGNLHERWKKTLSAMIETFLIDTGVDFAPSGGMSIRREDLDKGFEPDDCYYIQNVGLADGYRDLDFSKDPPPDLAVEVENTRSAVPKLPIYAAFRVPEVWRFDGEELTILRLDPAGNYVPVAASVAIPTLPVAELARFLKLAPSVKYPEIVRQFREFIRSLPSAS